jgi:hypothetical protein
MHRRRLLKSLGVLAVGSGTVVGTGAFTSTSAPRTVSVSVVEDRNAYLKLIADDDTGMVRTNASDGTLEFDIPGLNNRGNSSVGDGVGPDSVYTFLDLIEVTNQGTSDAQLYSRGSGLPAGIVQIGLVGPTGSPILGSANATQLSIGETKSVGLLIKTDPATDVSKGPLSATLQIIADASTS